MEVGCSDAHKERGEGAEFFKGGRGGLEERRQKRIPGRRWPYFVHTWYLVNQRGFHREEQCHNLDRKQE